MINHIKNVSEKLNDRIESKTDEYGNWEDWNFQSSNSAAESISYRAFTLIRELYTNSDNQDEIEKRALDLIAFASKLIK